MHNSTSTREEMVILLDRHGRPAGTAPKRTVHGSDTPLHLGFSCYLTDGAGRVLLTRRGRRQGDVAEHVDERLLRAPPAGRVTPRRRRPSPA